MRDIHAIITIKVRPGLDLLDFVMIDIVKSEKNGLSGANRDNTVK